MLPNLLVPEILNFCDFYLDKARHAADLAKIKLAESFLDSRLPTLSGALALTTMASWAHI